MTVKSVALGSLCEFTYGSGLPERDRCGGEVPVFGSNGIVGWHNKSITRAPVLIIGRKGSIGEVHYSEISSWPIDTTYYVDRTKVPCDLKWLYYVLLALDLTKLNKAAAVPGLNRNDAYEKLISLPPLEEQQRIAAVLAKADRLRQLRRYALQLSDTYLQAVFLQMFGDPVVNPMGWPLAKLKSIGKLDRGRSRHRPRNAPELLGGPYPLIQTGEIANAPGYITTYTQTYSEIGLAQSKMWPKGTLCITIAANIAKTAILTFDACFPDSVVGFTPNDKTNVEYIQQWFSFVQQNLEAIAPESAQKNINLEILRNLDVPLPPIALQNRFIQVVENFEQLRAQQREGARQADHLFDTLLHRAFCGELLIKDDNEFE